MKKLLSTKSILLLFTTMMIFTGCTTTSPTPSGGSSASTESSSDSSDEDPLVLSDDAKIVVLNNNTEPGNLHPGLANGTHESWILYHAFEGLFAKNEISIEPAGAVAYETSEDGLTWTFELNPDVRWSNGDYVTAHDYVTAWTYVLDPANASVRASGLYIISGAEDFNSNTDPALDAELREALGVRAIDDLTLEAVLEYPAPYFPEVLSSVNFFPIHTQTHLDHPDWYTSPEHFITNGPMYMETWRHRELVTLRPNPYYHRADDVNIDGIDFLMINDDATEWQMYQMGEIDLLYRLPPSVVPMLIEEEYPNLTIAPTFSNGFYMVNTQEVPFNNANVRKALAYSIDREVITTNITQGGQMPATTIVPPGVIMPNGQDYNDFVGVQFEEDYELARELLEIGLAEEGMTLDEFSVNIMYNTNDTHRRVAETIQIMWMQNLGVEATIENAEFQVTLDRRARGEYEVARAGSIGSFVDPSTFLNTYKSDHSGNDSGFNNAEYDRLIEAAEREPDPEARLDLLRQAEVLLIEEMPVIPLFYQTNQLVISPHITGVITPVDILPVVSFVDFEIVN